jgi:flagellar motor switch protein FliM
VDFEYVSSEVNPQFANIVSPTEVVVVSSFSLNFDDVGGDFHMTLPYAMVEPIRELLDGGMQSDRDGRDDRWARAIRDDMCFAEVEMQSTLLEKRLSVRELLELKAGDIVPVDLPGQVTLCAEGVPLFRGQFGTANGNNAVKVLECIKPQTEQPKWVQGFGMHSGNESDSSAGQKRPVGSSVEKAK